MSEQEKSLKKLAFDLERSMRYHSMRAHFMRKRHLHVMALIIAIAGTSVVGLAQVIADLIAALPWLGSYFDPSVLTAANVSTVLALLVAGLGGYDLLAGFSARAGEHLSYERVYMDMLAEAKQISNTDAEAVKRLKFRADAMHFSSEGHYRVVNAIAHNQVMEAHGYTAHTVRVPFLKKLVANYFLFSGVSFVKRGDGTTSA
jgi:hypothetical protein